MNLLVYSPLSLRFGGGFERWIIEVATRLKERGVSTEILCTGSTVGDRERVSSRMLEENFKKIHVGYSEVPYIPFSLGGFNSPFPRFEGLTRIFGKKDYDILYFPNAYAFQDLLVNVVKVAHDRPVVSGQHAVLFQKSKLHDLYINTIARTLLRKFDAYHVLNSQDLQVFREWGLANVYLIPIGIDTQRFRPKEFVETQARFRVLFVGRLTPQKGVDILCESIRMINQEEHLQEKVEFLIAGSGPMDFLVKNVVGQNKNVQHLNRVSDRDLPKVYQSCNILVMPSQRETFGIVALEAQSSGLPVIATGIPGPRDILIDGVTGRLIRSNDPISLTLAIKEYYHLWSKDHEAFKEKCQNSRENAVKKFNWDLIIAEIYRMLSTTCDDFTRKRNKG